MFVWNEKCITVFHISLPGIASAISEGSCNYETASFVGFTEFISIQVFTLAAIMEPQLLYSYEVDWAQSQDQ